jgi:hypothetical protein
MYIFLLREKYWDILYMEDLRDRLLKTSRESLIDICASDASAIKICGTESFVEEYNKLNPPKSMIIHIEGPVEYYDISVLGKRILIFGDDHIGGRDLRKEEHGCGGDIKSIKLVNFIKGLVSTKELTDVFFEITFAPYTEEDMYNRDKEFRLSRIGGYVEELNLESYLQEINRFFYGCLQWDKEDCEYPNSRFHWADIRWFLTEGIMSLIKSSARARKVDVNLARKVVENINVDKMMEEARITKQLSKMDKDMADMIRLYFLDKIYTILNEIVDIVEQDHISFKDLKRFLLFKALFMDMYVVSRIFKNLDQPMKRIFIYEGFEHARSIKDCLMSFPDARLISSRQNTLDEKNYQCLQVTLSPPFL